MHVNEEIISTHASQDIVLMDFTTVSLRNASQ